MLCVDNLWLGLVFVPRNWEDIILFKVINISKSSLLKSSRSSCNY